MRAILFLICTVLAVLSISAQVDFTENLVIDPSLYVQSPLDIFPVDLDDDGDMDVLTSSYNGDKLVWFENLDGLGGDFIQHTLAEGIDNPWGVHAADIDADGDMDVLAAALNGDHVIWYENINGTNEFVQKQFISAFEVVGVGTGDVDADGDLDVIWSSSQDGKMKWSRNTDGLGTFAGTLNIENSTSGIPNFCVVDVDGDNDLDVVSAWFFQGGTRGVSWYKNELGSGLFSSRITIGATTSTVSFIEAADLDGDGDVDVTAVISGEDKVVWYENTDGLGTFGPEQILSDTADGASRVRIADFDGDGNLDVIASSNEDDKIVWFQNLGFGNFSSAIEIASFLGNLRSLQIADMDGDGDLDFLTATDSDANIKWYRNSDGLGNFDEAYTITKNISGGKVIHAKDLDGDGDLDLLSASHWDDKVAWYENLDGQGNYYNTQLIISETLNGAGGVVAVDLDGDGDNDVVATSSLDHDVVWFENLDGHATFGEAQTIEDDLNSVNKVYISDIDNDGDMDIFCTARGKIIWYENTDGLGSFSGQQEVESINNFFMEAIDFGDLDGDGDLDISAASNYGLLYFINLDGQGTFGSRQTIEDFNFDGVGTKIADMDGDGDNDIVYMGESTSTNDYIGWTENTDGLGTFSNIQFISTIIINPLDLSVFDVDSDGDLDVVSSSWQGSGIGGLIAWYENTDGLGDFSNSQQVISTSTGSPWEFDLFETDINQDNSIDIVSITNNDDKIIWFGNPGVAIANEIMGTVRFDLLGDGCTTEDDLLFGLLLYATGTSNTNAAFTQENGQFRIFTSEEGLVDTQITSQLPNHYQSSPAFFQSNFTGLGNMDAVDFCIEPISAVNDLSVVVYPALNEPRPGFDTRYQIVYKNRGTTQLSGTVTFEFDDSKLNFLSSNETVASQTANTLSFNFTDVNPFETSTINLEFNVFPPPITNIDDLLVATASITPVSSDITEDDNNFVLEQTVIGSYDPNDIRCLEGDEIFIEDADNYLHYLIRFQNTGTASAINVRVEHVLDEKLDWSTMELESLSHDGRVQIENETDISFIFNNINLPDSTNDEPNSHGFIAFKIKPKSDVEIGDVFSAVADIYFDFNPPIITNTATTEIVEPLSAVEFDKYSVQLFPNPTKGKLNITSNQIINKLSVIDINGRLLRSNRISERNYSLDISELAKGVYFLEIQSGTSKSTKKFIKN